MLSQRNFLERYRFAIIVVGLVPPSPVFEREKLVHELLVKATWMGPSERHDVEMATPSACVVAGISATVRLCERCEIILLGRSWLSSRCNEETNGEKRSEGSKCYEAPISTSLWS